MQMAHWKHRGCHGNMKIVYFGTGKKLKNNI